MRGGVPTQVSTSHALCMPFCSVPETSPVEDAVMLVAPTAATASGERELQMGREGEGHAVAEAVLIAYWLRSRSSSPLEMVEKEACRGI